MVNISRLFYYTFIFENRYMIFVQGLMVTASLSFSSFVLGSVLGALFCSMKRSYKPVLQKISEKCCAFLIAIPTMVLLLVCVYVVFVDTPLPLLWIVIISLTLKCAAYICEIFNTSLDAISPGEIEAARALGMNRKKTFIYIILPQLINTGLELYKNQFILTMQETSVVGYVALVDLTRASSVISARTMDSLLGLIFITIIYFIIGAVCKKLLDLLKARKHLEV